MRLFAPHRAQVTTNEERKAIRFEVIYDVRKDHLLASLFLAGLFGWQLWRWFQHRRLDSVLFPAPYRVDAYPLLNRRENLSSLSSGYRV